MKNEDIQDSDLLLSTYWKRQRPYKADSVGELLERFVKSKKKSSGKSPDAIKAWKSVVPEQMRQFCRVAGFRNGILKIEIKDPALKFEFQTSKNDLLSSMLKEYPKAKIKDIKFI
ncbi:DUF721 domain-containing protein [Sedimentisphaera salicampi]|uniref:Zn-ribbon-containing protein n=1 Tax=Sedimentisphaera salicampi TaxID=1941349 RepID=A0A1W6LL36_9BACT|nr:DUF721 domain-containing protein [Sedimentisphaera salicampi]ARN56454.1 Zn-ribbon-containing protein [Sedimentisphaera salicampi]OXU15342.1 putative RNA-binding protein, Zn-ribbon-containing [Sedimentisphaera salicampi]